MEIQIHNFPKDILEKEKDWIALVSDIVETLKLSPESVNVIFVDDPTLQKMHLEYLSDPERTDVITFDLGEEGKIEGEIYISIDRAITQAQEYGIDVREEVLRLIIHGLLHLKGYDDLEPEKQRKMKQKEDRLVGQFKPMLS